MLTTIWSALESVIDKDEYIIATYLLERGSYKPDKIAEEIAMENSTGTWEQVRYETPEIRDRYGAKILNLWQVTDDIYILQLGIKGVNYNPETGGLAALLTDIAGNVFEFGYVKRIKLLDLYFPKSWISAFRGPKYGIEGVRELTGTSGVRRSLVGTIVKPNVGLDPKTVAQLVYEVALGGIDIIKDDEGFVDTKYCPIEDKVVNVMEALDKAKSETGKETVYAFNVTADRQDRMVEIAEKVLSHGGKHLMVSLTYVGFGGLRRLAEDPSIKAPILVHTAGRDVMSKDPLHGIDRMLIFKLARIVGGDIIFIGSFTPRFHYSTYENKKAAALLRGDLYNFKPALPMISGGIHPGTVESILNKIGIDTLITAGGGIIGHPDGPTAGAKAMMQAVEAYMKGIPVQEYAKEHKELATAIARWGIKEVE